MLAASATPTPLPTPTSSSGSGLNGIETALVILAMLCALLAAIVGYRIIRGGRGL
ncbi:MAG: hypothetical protein QOH90_1230 [Actinomycetota bacterium]|nr:hypothetical protein [Actinomycetota bacterium]